MDLSWFRKAWSKIVKPDPVLILNQKQIEALEDQLEILQQRAASKHPNPAFIQASVVPQATVVTSTGPMPGRVFSASICGTLGVVRAVCLRCGCLDVVSSLEDVTCTLCRSEGLMPMTAPRKRDHVYTFKALELGADGVLRSPSRVTDWDGYSLEAVCTELLSALNVPHEDCLCGIFGAFDPSWVLDFTGNVVFLIEHGGRTIIGETGVRSQYATCVAVVEPSIDYDVLTEEASGLDEIVAEDVEKLWDRTPEENKKMLRCISSRVSDEVFNDLPYIPLNRAMRIVMRKEDL